MYLDRVGRGAGFADGAPQEVAELMPVIPEASPIGVLLVVGTAAEHLVAAKELLVDDKGDPNGMVNGMEAVRAARMRREVDRHMEAAENAARLLDAILPLDGDDSWGQKIDLHADELAKQRADQAQASA